MVYKTTTRQALTAVVTVCHTNSVPAIVLMTSFMSLMKLTGSLALKVRASVETLAVNAQHARTANGMETNKAPTAGACTVNVVIAHVLMANEIKVSNRLIAVARATRALLAKTVSGMDLKTAQIVAVAIFMVFSIAHFRMLRGENATPAAVTTEKLISANWIGSMARTWVVNVVGLCVLHVPPATTANGTVMKMALIVAEVTATVHCAVVMTVN